MICVSLQAKSFEELKEKSARCEFAELRLDNLDLDSAQLEQLLSHGKPRIVTCRPGFLSSSARLNLFQRAIVAGASYLDLDIATEGPSLAELKLLCVQHGCKLIISYHDFEGTPSAELLREIVGDCFRRGADIVKVACLVTAPQDNARLLGLLGEHSSVVPVGMGLPGRVTRFLAPLLGSPITYAALSESEQTAPGQLTVARMRATIEVLRAHLIGAQDATD